MTVLAQRWGLAVTASYTWRRNSSPKPDRKSTRLNSSHSQISYAVFCLKKKNIRLQVYRHKPRRAVSSSPSSSYTLSRNPYRNSPVLIHDRFILLTTHSRLGSHKDRCST